MHGKYEQTLYNHKAETLSGRTNLVATAVALVSEGGLSKTVDIYYLRCLCLVFGNAGRIRKFSPYSRRRVILVWTEVPGEWPNETRPSLMTCSQQRKVIELLQLPRKDSLYNACSGSEQYLAPVLAASETMP